MCRIGETDGNYATPSHCRTCPDAGCAFDGARVDAPCTMPRGLVLGSESMRPVTRSSPISSRTRPAAATKALAFSSDPTSSLGVPGTVVVVVILGPFCSVPEVRRWVMSSTLGNSIYRSASITQPLGSPCAANQLRGPELFGRAVPRSRRRMVELLIVRDTFLGVTRFDDFQTRLGISATSSPTASTTSWRQASSSACPIRQPAALDYD